MKKVFIKTYGCSFNTADSENMAGLLEDSGRYKVIGSEDEADIVIINSCTVKNSAETKFWRDVKNIRKPKVLAGCVPQAAVDKSRFRGYSVIGTSQITKIVEAADNALSGNYEQLLGKESYPRLNIPKLRKNSIIEIIPINEGCLGSCTFCLTKFARGYLHSYPPEEIARQARDALNSGAKELWLTSQDTACYGYDIGTNIVELLGKILSMGKDFKIRLGMGNPDFLPDYLDSLIEVFRDERMFRFIHIPVQSGSDRILKEMKRPYTAGTYISVVKKIRQSFPDMTFSTDIICGYPGENDADFEETLSVVRETRPDVLNISRFWPRPGTIAAKKKMLPSEAIKKRSIELKLLHDKIAGENNKKWLGWQGKILIDEHGKNLSSVGRNYAYKPVILKKRLSFGEEPIVKIRQARIHDFIAEIVG